MEFYASTDLGSLPLIIDEGHEVISESSAELNGSLVVSATLTQDFVTYVGGKVIYVGDRSRCVRWRSSARCDEAEMWNQFVEKITHGCLRKLSMPNMVMVVFLPTLPKIESTAANLEKLAADIEQKSDHPDFAACGGRRVKIMTAHGRMPMEEQVSAVRSEPDFFKVVFISGIGDSSITPENCVIGADSGLKGASLFIPEERCDVVTWFQSLSQIHGRQRTGRTGRMEPVILGERFGARDDVFSY